MAKCRFSNSERGFSILETMVATGIMATALVGLAQMFAISVKNNQGARTGSYAVSLAEQKMEQLRGLTYGFDSVGLPLTDTTTNTAAAVETPTGGLGLTGSPPNTLTTSTSGYVDFVDQFGTILTGPTAATNAIYTRRWSIDPLPTNPNGTIVIQVMVTREKNRGLADQNGSTSRLKDEARIMSIKTRKAQ